MSAGRAHVRFRNLQQLLALYDGSLPLHLFLQEQFRKHKEWGSSDRRFYREYLYAGMRIGQSLAVGDHAERLLLTAFLRGDAENFDAWKEHAPHAAGQSSENDVQHLFPQYAPDKVFPFADLISPRLDKPALIQHLQQLLPVYARILPKAEKGTMVLPPDASLLPDNALRLPPGSDLGPWVEDGFLQVQDLGSQMVCRRIQPEPGVTCWDMCCGAGGKSLNLAEKISAGQVYCSDIRSNILENLLARFESAGFERPWTAGMDMSQANPDRIEFSRGDETSSISPQSFDLILADVPCSGSGTWSRNPENLCFYPAHTRSPEAFAELQRRLIRHAWPYLKPGGQLHYITCSVYAIENEGNARMLCEELGGTRFEDSYIHGYEQASDTLYHAVWVKT